MFAPLMGTDFPVVSPARTPDVAGLFQSSAVNPCRNGRSNSHNEVGTALADTLATIKSQQYLGPGCALCFFARSCFSSLSPHWLFILELRSVVLAFRQKEFRAKREALESIRFRQDRCRVEWSLDRDGDT